MSPELSEQDLADVRRLVEMDPGTELSRVKIRSRHANARVREAIRELERRGEVLVVTDRLKQYVWPMAAADEAAEMLANEAYHQVSFTDE